MHVATIGEGHDETATWNSERAGRRINHADSGRKKNWTPVQAYQSLKTKLVLRF